jgi:hypothetical protein
METNITTQQRTADYFSGSFGSPDSASDTVLMEMIELLLARGVVLPPRDSAPIPLCVSCVSCVYGVRVC